MSEKERIAMRSDSVKVGNAQAPHRSLFNALGYTEEERKNTILASNDPTFTIENCEALCEKVWGDLYNAGEKETWITKEY